LAFKAAKENREFSWGTKQIIACSCTIRISICFPLRVCLRLSLWAKVETIFFGSRRWWFFGAIKD
jgi:hypothetical protein